MTIPGTRILLLPAAALMLALLGCGATPHVESPDTEAASLDDQVLAARATLAELGAGRFADAAQADLARTGHYLDQVDRALAAGDGEEPEVELTFRTARASLAAIKSYYARREAEAVLDRVRDDFVRTRDSVDDLEQQNLRLLETPEESP